MGRFARWFGFEQPSVEGSGFSREGKLQMFGLEITPELAELFKGEKVLGGSVRKSEALKVGAVARARNLICGTLATLPIHVRDEQKRPATPTDLFDQINPDLPDVVTLAQTYEDLLFEGVAWWRVTDYHTNGFPRHAEHVNVDRVHVAGVGGMPNIQGQTLYPIDGRVFIDGIPMRDNEVIRFDSPNPPLLKTAKRAIKIAMLLEDTAAMYASEPLPLGYFAPKEGANVSEDREKIQELLDDWEKARRTRAWAYVGRALEAKSLQFDADQIQLESMRDHAVKEIARHAGVDPEDLAVSTTSRTYQNSEQRRLDLLDFTLRAFMTAVEQRLSMRDVLPRPFTAKANLDAFLRSDTKTRMETYEIGKRVGAYLDNEIRELEDRPPLPKSTADSVEAAQKLAEIIQKIYLGVGVVLTIDEAREIVNQAGANLPRGVVPMPRQARQEASA